MRREFEGLPRGGKTTSGMLSLQKTWTAWSHFLTGGLSSFLPHFLSIIWCCMRPFRWWNGLGLELFDTVPYPHESQSGAIDGEIATEMILPYPRQIIWIRWRSVWGIPSNHGYVAALSGGPWFNLRRLAKRMPSSDAKAFSLGHPRANDARFIWEISR